MLKIEIEMDEEGLKRKGYNANSINNKIKETFLEYGFKDISDSKSIVFKDKGEDGDLLLLSLAMSLFENEWFSKNVVKALWYNSDDGRDDDDFAVEDVLGYYNKNHGFLSFSSH